MEIEKENQAKWNRFAKWPQIEMAKVDYSSYSNAMMGAAAMNTGNYAANIPQAAGQQVHICFL